MNEVLLWRDKVIKALQSKTHSQQRLLRPFDLKRMAEDRGFWVGQDALESWDKLGIFHPLLRVQYPFSYHRAKPGDTWPGWEGEPLAGEMEDTDGVVAVIQDWSPSVQQEKPGVHPAVVVAPTVENFVAWSDYQQNDGDWGPVNTGGIFFHPYQIFRLSRVIRGCRSNIHFIDFTVSEKSAEFIRQGMEETRKGLAKSELYELKRLFLLLSIEDRYLPSLRGLRHQIHLTGFGFDSEPSDWFEFEKTFDARHMLAELPFTIDEIKDMRKHLAREGWNLDPNRAWFDLAHHIPHEWRQRLRGDALFAWDYYEAAEIIGEFLHDATGEPQPHVDNLQHGGKWKKGIYGIEPEEINYKTGNALKFVLARFTIDPRLKVLLIVEGESEMEYIRVWCEEQSTDLSTLGIRLFNTHGIPGGDDQRIRQVIEAAHEEDAAVVLVMDDENNAREKLQNWLDKGLIRRIFTMSDLNGPNHPIGGMLWEPCFEEANFSPDELILALADFLDSHPKLKGPDDHALLKAEVEKAYSDLVREAGGNSKTKPSWFNAMKRAGWRLRFTLHDHDKPEIAASLARQFGNTDRPIHRLLGHVQGCAILSNAYGRADPNGGYGRPDESQNP